MQQLLAGEMASLECRTGSFRLWQQKLQIVLGRNIGLSALLKQDLKLINVPKTVCSLASLYRVSLHALDCLHLASSSMCSDNIPAGIQHSSCIVGQIKIVYIVIVMVFALVNAKLYELFSQCKIN